MQLIFCWTYNKLCVLNMFLEHLHFNAVSENILKTEMQQNNSYSHFFGSTSIKSKHDDRTNVAEKCL